MESETRSEGISFIEKASIWQVREMMDHNEPGSSAQHTDEEVDKLRQQVVRGLRNPQDGYDLDGECSPDSHPPSHSYSHSDPHSHSRSDLKQAPSRLTAQSRPDLPSSFEIELEKSPFLLQDDNAFRKAIISNSESWPRPQFPSAEEVRLEARQRSEAIFEHRHTLNVILDRHEATIQKRWLKKTKPQRRRMLLAAWPGMNAMHRPDFDASRRESLEQRQTAPTKFRDAFLWPDFNLEDFVKPRILLLILKARGRHEPCLFYRSDIDACSVGYAVNGIEEPWLNRHGMVFVDRHDAVSYGELVAWTDKTSAFKLMCEQQSLPPGTGLTVLRVQERILHFLIDCCKEILHDIADPEDFPVLPEPDLTVDHAEGYASLSALMTEAPYKPPNGIDIIRLKAILLAKSSAAEDHLWSLREDPSYYADTLRELLDHRYEQVKDRSGARHPDLQKAREEVVSLKIVETIEEMLPRLGGKISPDTPLPKDLQLELEYFQSWLECSLRGPLSQLHVAAYSSPPLRAYVERRHPDDPKTRCTGLYPLSLKITRSLSDDGSPQGQLLWLLDVLLNEGPNTEYGITTIVDELGRLLHVEPEARDMVSPCVATIISDLSVMTECLRQLYPYKRQLRKFPLKPIEDDAGRHVEGLTVPWIGLLKIIEGSKPSEVCRLGIPTDSRFYYPVDKRRSRENHEAMRNLDAFWNLIESNLEVRRVESLKDLSKRSNALFNTAIEWVLSKPRHLQRTAEWIDLSSDSTALQEADHRPLSDVYHELERRTEHTLARPHNDGHGHNRSYSHNRQHGRESSKMALGSKPKTRAGLALQDKENTPPTGPPPSVKSREQPTFALDARALKVFRTIFYTPSISSTPGEVPWLDFVYAMSATGFAAEKLYGSVWNFRPAGLNTERSIQIHEPHPSTKIPYRTARRHGRRLEKAYGWHSGMFTLAEKPREALAIRQRVVNT
ncbi:hypothetical protein LTR17_014986 [Elasticomyces elasticus]|nr:hypothetical protein LTR17_014986 [Elasticomyces elasticus]